MKIIKEDKNSDDIDIEEIEIKTDDQEKDHIENDDTLQEKPELKDIYNKILDVLVKEFNKIRNKNIKIKIKKRYKKLEIKKEKN